MKNIYLAGPDVFRTDADKYFTDLKHQLKEVGLEGLSPFDNEIDSNISRQTKAQSIFKANVELIKRCDAVLANLTPFRGASADVGTVWEIGFAYGLGKPIFSYYNSNFEINYYKHRVINKLPHDGMLIEDFDLIDNLMIEFSNESCGCVGSAIIKINHHFTHSAK